MELTEKNWLLKPVPNQEELEKLSNAINVSYTNAALLWQRGVTSFEEARVFFIPDLASLHDPFLMLNMDKAVKRLVRAIEQYEKIIVYGDYDVDGTTSVSLVFSFLQQFHKNIDFYIPNRYTEGYGISFAGIEWAKETGTSLLISLDCGIKASERVLHAKSYGIDVIVCDHHLPDEDDMPEAYAILDTKQPGCHYPYKHLSGCGVGFKFMQAFCISQQIPLEKLYAYLDLVAVSIASDIVPITGENRILAYYGLKSLNENPRPGLKALREVAGFTSDRLLNISNVVFGLGPRINAAGRMEHAKSAVKLLLEETETEAKNFAEFLHKHNRDRQGFDSNITKEALAMIDNDEAFKFAKSTVLFNESWHKGVIGIVASRMIEHYHRPTIILTQSNDQATGSARSIHGFDVHAAIAECADLLTHWGGHNHAAGLSMPLSNLEAFRKRFEKIVSLRISSDQLLPQLEIDLPLRFGHINPKMYKVIQRMAPFGPDNPEPVFMSEEVWLSFPPQVFKDKHLKMWVHQIGSDDIEAIGWNMGYLKPRFSMDKPFRVCYHLSENHYNGNCKLQLVLKDIKFD